LYNAETKGMTLNPVAFYALSAGLVVSAILSTALPKSRVSKGAQVLLLLFCLGLLLLSNAGIVGLVLTAFCLSLLTFLSFRPSVDSASALQPNFKIGFLVWIVLGSFLLIIAVVLKYTKWTALRLESVADWKIILNEYGILLTLLIACLMAGFFWPKSKKT
jgi:hypothetical protein